MLAEIRKNMIERVMLQMVGTVVDMETQNIVDESIREAIVQRDQHLNLIASSVIRIRTARHFAL